MGLTAFVLSLPLGWLLTYLVIRGDVRRVRVHRPDASTRGLWSRSSRCSRLLIAIVAAIAPGRAPHVSTS